MRLLRKLPLLAALLGFIAAFVWLDNDKYFNEYAYNRNSRHNTSGEGTSLAFRYLKESRASSAPAVRELNRSIEFAELEPNAVVLRIAPEFKPGEREKIEEPPASGTPPPALLPKPPNNEPLLSEGEMKWVRKGGRLVLALDKSYGPVDVSEAMRPEPFEKTLAIWPHVDKLFPTPRRAVKLKGADHDNAIALFTIDDELFAARIPVEKGEVILLASPEIFKNDHVGAADNLRLLTALAPASRPIYFDEFVHGLRDSPGIGELLLRWGLGMALLIMTLGGLMLFWRARTPIGQPEDDHKETRTEAIDFVNALAPLYNRALEPHQAIALHYANFIHAVTVQTGLRGEDLRAKILSLLEVPDDARFTGNRPLVAGEFLSLLKTLNDANGRLERAHRR